MLLLRLPAVIFESHLLDFLPAGAGWALIAAAHFTEIDDRTITSYVNARGSQLLQMMEAILRDGLTVPVFEYRHVPTVLLSCPWRSHRPARERLGAFAFSTLGLPQQPETSFADSLMKFDTFMDEDPGLGVTVFQAMHAPYCSMAFSRNLFSFALTGPRRQGCLVADLQP